MSIKDTGKNTKDWSDSVGTDIDVKRCLEVAFMTPMGNAFGSAAGEQAWGLPIVVHAGPGAGKTSFYQMLAKRYGLRFVNMKPGARGEGGVGVVPLPVSTEAGAVYLDFPASKELVEAFPTGKGLILVDDLATMAPALQPAYLDVLQERQVGMYRFGGGVRVFGATNNVEDSAGGWDIASSVANRMGHMAWPDPTAVELGEFLQLSANKLAFDGEVLDILDEERRILAAWPDAYARAAQLFAGFLVAHPSMVRRQPDSGDPQASMAWASPRTIEYACRAYASAVIHKLPEAETHALIGAFVGRAWANEFQSYKVKADLPDPRAVLESMMAGTPVFVHSRTRLDRTIVMLQACTALVLSAKGKEQQALALGMWRLMSTLTEECADLLAPVVKHLFKAKLTSVIDADGKRPADAVIAAMQAVVTTVRV